VRRLDVFLIVAALLIAIVTITAVIVRAGGHDEDLISPASAPRATTPAPAQPQASSGSAGVAS
jgi:hypothetical protein